MKNSVPEEQPGEELNTTGNVETPATSELSAEVSSEQPTSAASDLQHDDQPVEELITTKNVETPAAVEPSAEESSEQPTGAAVDLQHDNQPVEELTSTGNVEETPATSKPSTKVSAKKAASAPSDLQHDDQPVEELITTEIVEAPAVSKRPAKATSKKPASAATDLQHDDHEEHTHDEHVDFSDEEAIIASTELDDDEGDDDDDTASHSSIGKEYSGLTKPELIATLKELVETGTATRIRKDIDGIKIAFYKRHKFDVDKERKAFIDGGGVLEEFQYTTDTYENDLKEYLKQYREKRSQENMSQEQEKEKNLEVKLLIIDEIKSLVESQENFNEVYSKFRELQKRWRELGPVPQARVNDLYENYNFAVEQFYDFLKINKELREIEFKKNFEAKTMLCEQAEDLLLESNVMEAFKTLQRYHELWREIGPVAVEVKETLWDRFREATVTINKKHQDYFERLRSEQKTNLEAKNTLCEKAEELGAMVITTHKEWNKRSKDLVELQKVWKSIGFAPKKENNKVYERFRKACDQFFGNKREFYLELRKEMDNNLQLKNDLCIQAEGLQDSTEWKKTTEDLINLQKRWKEIGPVPRKHSDEIWWRFRAACDKFFQTKGAHFSSIDSKYDGNLKQKEELIAEITAFVPTEDTEENFRMLKDFQRRWSEIGYVPIKDKERIQNEYRQALNVHFENLKIDESQRNLIRYKTKLETYQSQPKSEKRVRQERDRFFIRIKQLESDIHLWENNIGFFAKSKNAEAMIRDVKAKVEKARAEIKMLEDKVRLIDSMDE